MIFDQATNSVHLYWEFQILLTSEIHNAKNIDRKKHMSFFFTQQPAMNKIQKPNQTNIKTKLDSSQGNGFLKMPSVDFFRNYTLVTILQYIYKV